MAVVGGGTAASTPQGGGAAAGMTPTGQRCRPDRPGTVSQVARRLRKRAAFRAPDATGVTPWLRSPGRLIVFRIIVLGIDILTGPCRQPVEQLARYPAFDH